MRCRHPAIVGGRCIDCGALVNGENVANKAAVLTDGQIHPEGNTQPENGQETPKKPTRKRKA